MQAIHKLTAPVAETEPMTGASSPRTKPPGKAPLARTSPAKVSAAPPAVPVAHAAADDAPIRPIDAPATTPTASSVAVANTDTAVAAPVWPALPNNLPAESVQYLVPPAPVYPRLSRRQGETGRVLVRVYIDEAGLPRSVQLSASSGHGRLDDAALQAVQREMAAPMAAHWSAVYQDAALFARFDTLLAGRLAAGVLLAALAGATDELPLQRLVIERSLSLNTAAAGGNASLMAGG